MKKYNLSLKEIYLLSILVVILVTIINSCKKDTHTEQQINITDGAINQAKDWYQSTFPLNSNLKTQSINNNSDLDYSQVLKPNWKQAVGYKRFNDQVIEIPIDLSSGKISTALSNSSTGIPVYKKEYSRSSFLLLNNGISYKAYIMTIIADPVYLKNDLTKLDHNKYNKRDSDFSGVVLYATPKGKFVSMWFYTKGVISNSLIAGKDSVGKSGPQVQSLTTNKLMENCTDWYQQVTNEDGTTSWKYLDSQCTVTGDAGDGSFGSGSAPPVSSGSGSGNGASTSVIPCITINSVQSSKLNVNSLQTNKNIVQPPDGGDGGMPPPEPPEPSFPCAIAVPPSTDDLDNNETDLGTAEINGERDPDFPSNCASWAYVPVVNGTYQVCGITDLRFDYITEFQNSNQNLEIDYFRGTFGKTVYFEFPAKRIDGSVITPSEAARLTAIAKDNAEEILESQVESSPPPSSSTEVDIMLKRFFNILQSQVKMYGGRATYQNNYGTNSVKPYSKGIGGC